MRDGIRTSFKLMIGAGAALLVVACSGGGDTNAATANAVDSNMMVDIPANDASALEAAANATEPLPETNAANEVEAPEPGGEVGEEAMEANDVAGM